jgi:hypothetical protein
VRKKKKEKQKARLLKSSALADTDIFISSLLFLIWKRQPHKLKKKEKVKKKNTKRKDNLTDVFSFWCRKPGSNRYGI